MIITTPKRLTSELTLMLSSTKYPTLFPSDCLSIGLHFTILRNAPWIIGMRAEWWNEVGDSLKTTCSDRYRDPRLGFKKMARSINEVRMLNMSNKEFVYVPIPSNPIPKDLVKCNNATRGIIKVEVPFELAEFGRLKILSVQVQVLLSFQLL